MRGSSRPPLSLYLQFIFALCLALCVSAAPASPIIHTTPTTGNLTVFDPTTLQPIPQFPATDGGAGRASQALWILFGVAIGAPYGGAGVRGGRLSVGTACGLVGTVSIWAAFVNSLPMPLTDVDATADLILTLILLGAFTFLTFLGAFLRAMHPFGLGLLGATAGTSVFMRIVIIKGGLLISIYPLNLALLGVGAVLGGILVLWNRRWGVIISTSLISTFLIGLATDLILNMNAPQDQGMSRGLRLLMDRNPAHLADIIGTNYQPTLKTQVVIAVSLGLVPVLAFAQHRVFGGPFTYDLRRTLDDVEEMGTARLVKQNVGRYAIGGPEFGAVGHGSRFST